MIYDHNMLAQQKFFIKRESLVEGDETEYFNDNGKRLFFDFAWQVSHFLVQFKPEQRAKIVKLYAQPDDKPANDFIKKTMLPENVTIEQYWKSVKNDLQARRRTGRKRGRKLWD
ncbi:MAG: hypothetical protein DRP52_01655 [Planctomycetota bacterium]|nr:MAG: hypothetical protein DRP52_01655 [Planctomycetota bacterium]RLC83039.1 MAG: hypothetical protein DRJ03_18130 [Chloroflexota bacterium]